jgi:hypothetical protein
MQEVRLVAIRREYNSGRLWLSTVADPIPASVQLGQQEQQHTHLFSGDTHCSCASLDFAPSAKILLQCRRL